ncbi:MAG: DUF3990 domain-containing protein [Firmicutes bacterium]|nr:DUF3990 domain-containing protein [Bacillota bacterium]
MPSTAESAGAGRSPREACPDRSLYGGQGFYTTDDLYFALCWAPERKASSVIVNEYILELSGLRTRRFEQDEEWFSYILANRRLKPDALEEADVVIGPVSADTVCNTLGLFTSGALSAAQSVELLSCMPVRADEKAFEQALGEKLGRMEL